MTRSQFANLLLGWGTITAIACGQQPSEQSLKSEKKVVFVCEHGAAKSVIAAKEFERLAKEMGFRVQSVTRGTVPDAEIADGVRKGLRADGMDVGAAKPVKVSAADLQGADIVVSFGPDLSSLSPKGTKILDWSATPSPSKDYSVARDYIKERLAELAKEMKK